MIYRFTQGRPEELTYRDGVIHFRVLQLADFYWHLLAVKGRRPRREKEPLGQHVSIFRADELPKIWDMERDGFVPITDAGEKIMERLVRDGLAERVQRKPSRK